MNLEVLAEMEEVVQDCHGGTLDLSDLHLTYEHVQQLIPMLAERPDITEIDISYNKIGDRGAMDLAQTTHLTKLKAHRCNISNDGAIALAKNTNFTHLDLFHNGIRHKGRNAVLANENLVKHDVRRNHWRPHVTIRNIIDSKTAQQEIGFTERVTSTDDSSRSR